MKLIILFLLSIIAQLSNAQVNSKNTKNSLTNIEVEQAKKLFIQMMKSETYIKLNNSIHKLNEKASLMDTDITEVSALKTRDDIKKLYRTWLIKNLKDTKFKSVEEGLAAYMETFDLSAKNLKENAEFFELLYKANAPQKREIMAPQIMSDRERVLAPKY